MNHIETPSGWKGRIPTVAQLERFVMAGVVATMPGYHNEPIGYRYGVQVPSYARIRENKPGGRVMVEWKAPTFMCLPNPADFPEVCSMDKFWADTETYLNNTGSDGTELARRKAHYSAYLDTMKAAA